MCIRDSQGTLQAEQEFKAIGHTVSIGSDQDNLTRLFVKTIEPVLIEGDLSVNNRLYVSENLTVGGSLNIGPDTIPANAIIGINNLSELLGTTGPTGPAGSGQKGDSGTNGLDGATVLLVLLGKKVNKVLLVLPVLLD